MQLVLAARGGWGVMLRLLVLRHVCTCLWWRLTLARPVMSHCATSLWGRKWADTQPPMDGVGRGAQSLIEVREGRGSWLGGNHDILGRKPESSDAWSQNRMMEAVRVVLEIVFQARKGYHWVMQLNAFFVLLKRLILRFDLYIITYKVLLIQEIRKWV